MFVHQDVSKLYSTSDRGIVNVGLYCLDVSSLRTVVGKKVTDAAWLFLVWILFCINGLE